VSSPEPSRISGMIRVGRFRISVLLSFDIVLFKEPRENMVQLVDQFAWWHRLGFGMLGILSDDAGLKMASEQFDSERIERGTDGGNLVQDIDAVPIVFDHSLNTGHLAGDPIGPAPNTFAGLLQHLDTYTRYVYNANPRGPRGTG
jgi:hypothetical protein